MTLVNSKFKPPSAYLLVSFVRSLMILEIETLEGPLLRHDDDREDSLHQGSCVFPTTSLLPPPRRICFTQRVSIYFFYLSVC